MSREYGKTGLGAGVSNRYGPRNLPEGKAGPVKVHGVINQEEIIVDFATLTSADPLVIPAYEDLTVTFYVDAAFAGGTKVGMKSNGGTADYWVAGSPTPTNNLTAAGPVVLTLSNIAARSTSSATLTLDVVGTFTSGKGKVLVTYKKLA